MLRCEAVTSASTLLCSEEICNPNEGTGQMLQFPSNLSAPLSSVPLLAAAGDVWIGLFEAQSNAADLGLLTIIDA